MAQKEVKVEVGIGTAPSVNIHVDPETFNGLLKELDIKLPRRSVLPRKHDVKHVDLSERFTPNELLQVTARAINPASMEDGLAHIGSAVLRHLESQHGGHHFEENIGRAIGLMAMGITDPVHIPAVRISAGVGLEIHSSLRGKLSKV